MWTCRCDCGNIVTLLADNLTGNRQKSCGCYRKEHATEMFTTHGQTNSRLYGVWSAMKSRCYNKNVYEYHWYGERGITVCDEWKDNFQAFYSWAIQNGYDENADRGVCTIDRIDSNQGYCPENCRIVPHIEQMNNIRTNHIIEWNGESHTIAEWSRITGINQFKIRNRISRLGWTPERALQTI